MPAAQQRVLHRIEGALRASEPRLTSMYSIFTRLSAAEPIATERLVPGRRWLQPATGMYAIALVPVLFAAVIVGALLGTGARSANACEVSYSLGVSPLAAKPSCPVPNKAAVAKDVARKTVAATARLACNAATPARFTILTGRDLLFPPAVRIAGAAAGSPGMC